MTIPAGLLKFLEKLRNGKIHFHMECNREDAIAVVIAVPGERWEVDFFENGEVYVEVFRSDGTIGSQELLTDLLAKHSS